MKINKLDSYELLDINLQLFAGDEDDVSDDQEDVVDPQDDDSFDDNEDDSLDENEGDDKQEKPEVAELDKPKQSFEDNEQYKKMRKHAKEAERKELEAERIKLEAEKKQIESFRQQQAVAQIEQKYLGEVTHEAVEKLAYDEGISEDFARKHLLQDAKNKAASEIHNFQVRSSQYQTHKAELRNKPYFKELEPKIDSMCNQNPHIDVKTAYNYLRGVELDELIANTKSNAEKRTIANVQDNARRRSVPNGGADTGVDVGKVLSKDDIEMAAAFGNDPRRIAKIVKQHNQNKKRS